MSGFAISRKQIINIITGKISGKIGDIDRLAGNYRNTLNFIRDEWLVSKRSVKPATISSLIDHLFEGTKTSFPWGMRASLEENMKLVLTYLATKEENPVIEAGIISSQILSLGLEPQIANALSNILSYLFLYRRGYDVRQFLVIEDYMAQNENLRKEVIIKIEQQKSLNDYLLFFVSAIYENMEKTYKQIQADEIVTSVPAQFFNLTDRQKEVMEDMQEPGMTITNRKVQKKFRISQITASRDLSRLASLGLLFPHGKGRSVYYTKA
jgi:hypothetical protein